MIRLIIPADPSFGPSAKDRLYHTLLGEWAMAAFHLAWLLDVDEPILFLVPKRDGGPWHFCRSDSTSYAAAALYSFPT
jgi:hypothetical protein